MAASGSTSRAVYAGLSCGFVFAVPVAAYVATMPFPDANSSVTSLALPFTMGALAGVGILSAVSAVGRRHAITVIVRLLQKHTGDVVAQRLFLLLHSVRAARAR